MRRIGLFIAFISICAISWAQTAALSMKADRSPVGLNERFRLIISLDGVQGEIIPPDLKDFNIVGGPSVSSSMSWINGQMSNSLSHTYFLSPKRIGTFTIPPAKAQSKAGSMESRTLSIEVVEGNNAGQQPQQQAQQSAPSNTQETITNSEECFVKILTDKRKAVKGEPITVSYVLYNRYHGFELTSYEFPTLSGFWKEEIKLNTIQWEQSYEQINGKDYQKAYFVRQVLIPQRSGELEIGPFILEARVGRSFFRQGTPIRITSNVLKINVSELPPAPESFTGGVGKLDFNVKLDRTELMANEAINLTITVSGKGNIPLVEAPKLNFPSDFEVYDPKVIDKSIRNAAGISGSKTYEYLIIPRYPGSYDIEALEISYYDPDKRRYETETSEAIHIEVLRDDGSDAGSATRISRKEDVSSLGSDIRHIRKDTKDMKPRSYSFAGSFGHLAALLSPFLLLAVFLVVRRRKERSDADPLGTRQRSAAKTAARYLKEAKKKLQAGQEQEFYITLYQAMNDYISHKYQIPLAQMTKEKIHEELDSTGVDRGTISGWQRALADCEMARYAPSAQAAPQALYEQVESLIALLERKA